MIKLYKWKWKNDTNGYDKAIQIDATKLHKWMWENSGKTIKMDLTKLYKSVEQMDMIRLWQH